MNERRRSKSKQFLQVQHNLVDFETARRSGNHSYTPDLFAQVKLYKRSELKIMALEYENSTTP